MPPRRAGLCHRKLQSELPVNVVAALRAAPRGLTISYTFLHTAFIVVVFSALAEDGISKRLFHLYDSCPLAD
jgi:hypothetical protein